MNLNEWKQQYEAEAAHLIEILGRLTEGGLVEAIQHIGATSLSGLSGSNCVDIAVAVAPFPLDAGPRAALEALGYQLVEDIAEPYQQRFRHRSGAFQLFVFESGIDGWFDYLLMNDYLRHNEKACRDVSQRKKDNTSENAALFHGFLPEAQQWWIEHYGFSPLEAVANEFQDASFEWYISGGWALELFLGDVKRMHHDVDVIVPRSSQLELQKHLTSRGWKLLTPFEKRLEPWPAHMRLDLPRHQIHAHRDGRFIDLLLTDMDGVWRYRREPAILRAREKMSLTSERGIPYLAPELVLLFKSRNTSDRERSKDQPDFEKTLPHLEPERRAWLYWALTATTPDHPWLKQLL